MKRYFIFFLFIVLCSCQPVKEITINAPKIQEINISFNKITTNSVNFNVNSKYNNLNYTLLLEENIIKEGIITDTNFIGDLEENTEYLLKIYNNEGETLKGFKTKSKVKLTFAGDVLMDMYFVNYIGKYGVDYPLQNIKHLTASSDIAMLNLETSVSERGASTKPVGYGFRSKPNTLQGLVNAGIDIVSIGNNHVLDYGYNAFLDTLDNLNKYNIKYVGAGRNLEDAISIRYIKVKNVVISYIGASKIIPNWTWVATDQKGGIMPFRENYYEMLYKKIEEAKQNSDIVIFSLHWGTEHVNYPSDDQIKIAHTFIDKGVDIFVGHHAHVLQGVEYYNTGVIFYSLGNFSFLVRNDNASKSGLMEVTISDDKIEQVKIHPTQINSCKVNLLEKNSKEYNNIIENLNERSKNFNTKVDENGIIQKIVE